MRVDRGVGAGGGVFGGSLLVHPGSVGVVEVVEVPDPVCCLVEVCDSGELQGEAVERFTCGGAWFAGGVAADCSLGVDQAALDFGGGPAAVDG